MAANTEKIIANIMTIIAGTATVILIAGLALMFLHVDLCSIFFQVGIALILAVPPVIAIVAGIIYIRKKQAKMAAVSLALFAVLFISIFWKMISTC